MSNLLTNSRLRTWRDCKRRHRLLYLDGWRPRREDEAVSFGRLAHLGLEGWWKAAPEQRLYEAMLRISGHAHDLFQEAAVRELLRAYDERYASTMEGYEVLAVEATFTAPLVNPETGAASRTFLLAGKVDGIVRERATGRVLLLEHKCLAPESRIRDHATGRLLRVDEMARLGIAPVVLGYDPVGRCLRLAQAEVPRPESVRPAYVVRMRSGRTLRVSDNHPIWTRRGWVEAARLTCDDSVGVPESTGGRCDAASPLDDHEVRFIGYMLGDGCFSNLHFTKTDPAVRADLRATLDELGAPHRQLIRGDRAPTLRISRARGSAAVALCERLELTGLAADKRVPDEAFGITDRQVGLLLGALWSTDGSIDVYREERQGQPTQEKIRIAYCSRSRQLCDDIQRLLLRLGLWSSVTASSIAYREERRPYWTLKIVGRDMKRRFLTAVLEGTIPMLRSRDEARRALGAIKPGVFSRDPQSVDGLFWDRVASVEIDAPTLMYDLTVPGLHTFVVDDVVTHNTTSEPIEDATTSYWRRLAMDGQVSHYYIGSESLGYSVEGCLYDVLLRPRLKPLKATPEASRKYTKDGRLYAAQRDVDETPEEYAARLRADIAEAPAKYFQRREVPRTEDDLRDYLFDAWAEARAMREAERSGASARNPEACHRFGQCAFWEVCANNLRPESAPDLYELVGDVHPELELPGVPR